MTKDGIIDRAEALFHEGYACSEAVVLAVGEPLLPDFDRRLVRAATPWSGGIAYGGSVCGSLAAGVMLLGLAYGRATLDEPLAPALRKARVLRKAFEKRFGALLCHDLTGGKFHKAGDTCVETVRFAAEKLVDLLQDT